MKKFQRWMGVLLIGFAASSLIVACGDDEDLSCIDDSDCIANSESCNLVTDTCALNCTDDASICQGDEVCAGGVAATGSICVSDGNTEPECTSTTDCAEGETCNSAGVCEDDTPIEGCVDNEDCSTDQICVEGTCETPSDTTTYNFIELLDTTTSDDGCDGDDPGSDIFGIELTKAIDGSKAYAKAFNGNITGEHARDAYDLVLDGSPSGYTGGACLEFSESFSLGCGGKIVAEFLDGDGNRVEIQDGDDVLVMEYGGTCGGDDFDSWDLSVCAANASRDTLVGDIDACNGTSQGGFIGLSSVTISL